MFVQAVDKMLSHLALIKGCRLRSAAGKYFYQIGDGKQTTIYDAILDLHRLGRDGDLCGWGALQTYGNELKINMMVMR